MHRSPQAAGTRRRSLLLAMMLVAVCAAGSLALISGGGSGASTLGGSITSAEINQRAQYWITNHVMYSQKSYTWDIDHSRRYRQDCSGFVTMAWHANGDYWTGNMLSISHRISLTALRPGDAMLAPSHHTALFEGWANSAHSIMAVWEESTYGKAALKTTWGRSYFSGYLPVRYNHLGGAGSAPAPHPKPPASSWPTMARGAHGSRVTTVQLLLRAHGSSLSADGAFGPVTAAAVRRFQSARHLAVDGVVGAQTWSALIVQLRRGSHGSAVAAVQRDLRAHGYALTADGDFGPRTAAAVRSYQSAHHLAVDGIVGPQTWRSLVS
jgi:Putative peptidoglycan binding domain